MELRYTEQIFSENDACSAGDLISLHNVEVYVLARVAILRVYSSLNFNIPGCRHHVMEVME